MATLSDLILKLGVNAKDFDKGLGQSMRKLNAFGKNTKKLGKQLTASLTLPLAAIGASSFKVAADFEQSMLKVKAVSGATAKEFRALEADALRLGSSTRFTASEVSSLQLEFSKLGFSATEITKVTESTLALAQATGSDLATSAEVAGSTLRAFGLDASETQRVTDVMAQSFSSSALDMASFKDSMKFVAPVAKAAGLSIEQTTGLLGALANNGIKGSQAGTALRRIISELGATGGDVTEALAQLSAEGLNLADAKDEVGRSAQSALLILSENIPQVNQLTTEFQGAKGAAADMAATMDSGSSGAIARMKSALEGAQIVIGKALAPTIEKLAGFVSGLATKFSSLDSSTQTIIITIAGVVAAIGPLLVILPAIASAFALLTSPITLIALGIAGLIYVFYEFWDVIKTYLVKIINYFINLYNESTAVRVGIAIIKETVSQVFQQIIFNVKLAVEAFMNFAGVLKTLFTKGPRAAFREAKKAFSNLGNMVIERGKDVAEGYANAVQSAIKRNPIEYVTEEDLQRGADKLKNFFGDFLGGGGTVVGGTGGVEIAASASETLHGGNIGPAGLMDIGPSIAEGLDIEPVSSFFNTFRDEVSNTTTFVDELQMSARTMGEQFGEAFGMLITGAEGGKEALKDAASSAIDSAFRAATGHIIEAAIASGKNFGPAAMIAIPALITAGMGLVRGAFQGITGLADGGIISGDTIVNVGEYAGVQSNPEVIAPLDKLKGLLADSGAGAVTVRGVIRGKDIFLSNERAGREMFNLRGI